MSAYRVWVWHRYPVQIAQELRGVWNRALAHAQVKKDLKGRYTKHKWRDEPWSATAAARANPGRS